MARRKQLYLKRRGNRFYHRQRIPQDLAHRFHSVEFNVALWTSDIDLAARRSRIVAMAADELFDRVRGDTSLTPKDIAELAREHLRINLEADERRRLFSGRVIPEREIETLEHLRSEAVESLKENELTEVKRIVDAALEGSSFEVEKGSPEYNELCRAILRAQVERYHLAIERARGDYSARPADPLFASIASHRGPAKQDNSPLLSEIFDKWQGERQLKPKTLSEWKAAFRMFYEIVGDKPIKAITREDARDYKDTLLKVPASMSKRFKGLTVQEAIEKASEDPEAKLLSPASVNKYLVALSSVASYAETNGYVDKNVFSKLKVAAKPSGTDKRLPYSDADLKKIFSWPIYTGAASATRRMRPGSVIIKDALYWLPLLALYTGCRAEELCQAEVRDVKKVRGIWVLDVNEEGEKEVKAQSSRRLVPLHPELERVGFLKYVEEMKAKGESRLFPDLTRGAFGKWAANWSKKWGRYQREMGITDPRKVFHSFRHRFRDALREAQVDTSVANALMGHSDSSMGARYGQGFSVEVLSEAITNVQLPAPKGR